MKVIPFLVPYWISLLQKSLNVSLKLAYVWILCTDPVLLCRPAHCFCLLFCMPAIHIFNHSLVSFTCHSKPWLQDPAFFDPHILEMSLSLLMFLFVFLHYTETHHLRQYKISTDGVWYDYSFDTDPKHINAFWGNFSLWQCELYCRLILNYGTSILTTILFPILTMIKYCYPFVHWNTLPFSLMGF